MSTEPFTTESSTPETWYIVKQANEQCAILPAAAIQDETDSGSTLDRWGPFSTQAEAIARRVGLIRAGKCKPA